MIARVASITFVLLLFSQSAFSDEPGYARHRHRYAAIYPHVVELVAPPFSGQLVVNGSGLKPGDLGVEVRTAENATVVEGFERANCVFSEVDSICSRVSWQGAPKLAKGRYRLRFVFSGLETNLYSFGFE